jgi:hypothetical protein
VTGKRRFGIAWWSHLEEMDIHISEEIWQVQRVRRNADKRDVPYVQGKKKQNVYHWIIRKQSAGE